MFSTSQSGPRQKCYVSHGLLPLDLRTKNTPRSRKPFSSIFANPWYHTVDLILPEELLAIVQDSIDQERHFLPYSRVHMKLEELLDGDFFNVYIKTGNIEMLSQGPPVLETQYSLREGILRLDMPKHIFQRLGLDGKPISSGGRKHIVSRMRIDINLRLPSMVKGRKGFERIRWAFKTVLNESVTWLFRDIKSAKSQNIPEVIPNPQAPISSHHPLERSAHPPSKTNLDDILIPDLSPPPRNSTISSQYLYSDTCHDTLEWLSLIAQHSPRITSTDNIDTYLSRYALPSPFTWNQAPSLTDTTDPGIPTPYSSPTTTMTTLRWHGFIPASWLLRIAVLCTIELQGGAEAWFAISAKAMVLEMGSERKDGLCLLMFPLPLPLPRTSAVDAESKEEVDDENDGMDIDLTLATSTVGKDVPHESPAASSEQPASSKQRDFVIWEFVDCVTER